MQSLTPHKLLAIAKGHLGYSTSAPDTVVPSAYLKELRKHTLLYPEDINYRVTLEQGRGYGKVTCLELGCNRTVIPLIERIGAVDGGWSDGLGSLSVYRVHIIEHPTHTQCRQERIRDERVKAERIDVTPASTPVVKKTGSRLLDALDNGTSLLNAHASGSRSTPQHMTRPSSLMRVKVEPSERRLHGLHFSPISASCVPQTPSPQYQPVKGVSSLVRVKPEAVEPELPRKRAASTLPTTVKKPKLERPLFPIDNSLTQLSTKVEDLKIQPTISHYEDMINLKSKLTKADATRLQTYRTQLAALRDKEKCQTSIPNVSPLRSTLSKPRLQFTSLPVPSPFNHAANGREGASPQGQPVASGSNVRLPGAYDNSHMEIDTDDEPAHVGPLPGAEHFDENGDFHGRGRDTFVGPQAKADDIDKFLLEAGNAEQFDGNATLDQALEKLGLRSQYDPLPGMEVALMPHQAIGVAWMVEKEKSKLKGGCLGDDMGLGKTVQMIATLVKNRSEDPICKTNLIIAPTALLDQWKLEIEMKTNCNLKCLIYHGASKPRRKHDLLQYDVILTTYATMAFEWPDFENEQKKKAKAKKKKDQDFIIDDSDEEMHLGKSKKKQLGLLFQVDFYRVILDEAQAVRNRRTRTSRAVTDLQAVYRWCLTGTPIINSLGDVYGYLRFLKIRPWYDFQEFQSHIGVLEKRNPSLAVSRLQTVIATFLLRRMKDTTLDGKRLIELPDKTTSLVKLQFSEEELEIYKMVETNAQTIFNRFLRAGTVLKNYSQVLVLLLRLRQICSHPSLIQEGGGAFIDPADNGEDVYCNRELSRARRLVSPEFVNKMKEKFKVSALERMEAERSSADAAAEDEECPICFDNLTDAVITPCTHVFCRDCIREVLNAPVVNAIDEPARFKANERPCPTCRSPICSEKLFARTAFLPSDAELLPGAVKAELDPDVMGEKTTSTRHRKGKGKAEPKRIRRLARNTDDVVGSETESSDEDDGDDLSDFIVNDDADEEEVEARQKLKRCLGKRRAVIIDPDDEIGMPEESKVLFGKKPRMSAEAIKLMPKFLPSTKMKFMIDRLTELVKKSPEEKTLVVSQWTGCLSLVSAYLAERGVIHVKYQGDMNRAQRDQAVRVFMSKDKARVMLMSLKCGGVGLNLTRANNVISLDLGWSQAIEAQSFDRVHRLGQTRPVVVQRLVISDTVEDRVLAMQERKQLLADGSLGEGTGKKIGRLSVKELANLFGLDHRGRLLNQN